MTDRDYTVHICRWCGEEKLSTWPKAEKEAHLLEHLNEIFHKEITGPFSSKEEALECMEPGEPRPAALWKMTRRRS